MREHIEAFEHKHNLRCLWQAWTQNRTILIECLWRPTPGDDGPGEALIVTKHYARPVPRFGSSRPWPEVEAYYVHRNIGGGTWEALDRAVAAG